MFDGIKDRFKEYLDTKIQLFQLTIEEKMVNFGALLFYIFLVAGVAFITFTMILIFVAKIICSLTNNQYLGYGIVATLCLILLWLLSLPKNRNQITNRIKDQILLNIKK